MIQGQRPGPLDPGRCDYIITNARLLIHPVPQ